MSFTVLILILTLMLTGCQDDKQPYFPELDADVADIGSERGNDEPIRCTDHSDCDSDEVCFERICVDIDEVIDDCWDDSDCPDGWICVDEDYCEEE